MFTVEWIVRGFLYLLFVFTC